MTTEFDSTMRPVALTAGIIGGGFMAETHSRALRMASVNIRAIASSSLARASDAAQRLGAGQAYASPYELINDPLIDVVHICTPNSTHVELAELALNAGKHVICEKPIATTLAGALSLAASAERAAPIVAVPFVYRFHPMVREAAALRRSGALGEVHSVQGTYLQDWLLSPLDVDWRTDTRLGGRSRAFADIGSHLVDLIEFVTGESIMRVNALTRQIIKRDGSDNEDLAAVVFESTNGMLGTLLVSQVAPGRKNRLVLDVMGTLSSVQFNQEEPETLWIGRRNESTLRVRDPAYLSADAARLSRVPAGHPMGYQDAFNNFVSDAYSAFGGTDLDGLPTVGAGVRAAAITDAVLASADSGGWADVHSHDAVLNEPAA